MIQISLKNVSVDERLSEETYCYSAVLVVDGKDFAIVGNAGHGGGDDVKAFLPPFGPADYLEVRKRVAAEYPPLDMSDYGLADVPTDLDTVCGTLVEGFLRKRNLDKVLKNKVAFFQHGLPPEGTTAPLLVIAMQKAKGRRPADTAEGLTTYVEKTYPGALVLNGLSEDKQMEAYLRAATS